MQSGKQAGSPHPARSSDTLAARGSDTLAARGLDTLAARGLDLGLSRRFGTKAARFRCAVTLGFFVAAIGFATFGPASQTLFAQESFWGAMSGLFGQPYPQQPQAAAADFDAPPPRAAHRHARRHAANGTRLAAASAAPGRQSLCVRACDGYAFPVGAYHGDGDRTAHESICQSSCPDAATTLYVMPAGSDRIDEAVSVKTGRAYSQLPDAFHYATVLDDACTCHKAIATGRTASLLRDFTLRRGDAVMTASGVQVFHGQGHFPYNHKDFVALSRSRDVRGSDRATFGAIERASLKAPAGTQAGPDILLTERKTGPAPFSARGRFQQQASR